MAINERDIRIIIDALLDARETFIWAVEQMNVLREKSDRPTRYGGEPLERTLEGVVQVVRQIAPHADPQAEELADAWLDWCQDRHDRIARNGAGPERLRQELRAAQAFNGKLYIARLTAEEMVKRFATGRNEQSGAKELLRAWGPSCQRCGLSERFQKACLCLEVATEEIVMNDFFSGHLLDRAMGRVGQASVPALEPAMLDATTARPRIAASAPKPKCGGLYETMLIGNVFQHLTLAAPGATIAAAHLRRDEHPHLESQGATSIQDTDANGDGGEAPTVAELETDEVATGETRQAAIAPPPGEKSQAKRSRRGRKPEISKEVRERWLEIRKDYDDARKTSNFDLETFREARDLAPEDLTRILNYTTPAKLKRRQNLRNNSAE